MRNSMMTRIVGGLGLALAVAAPAGAQLANPSPAALGMGDNYTAAARGYAATAWNPANLGLAGNPGWSLNVASVRGIAGIDPVTLADFKDYEGELVPATVKTQWLNAIRQEGGEEGTSGFDGTWLALQVGRFGLQLSSSGRALANLSPGVAELIMFGNADASGTPQTIDLGGSTMDMAAYSTLGASWAQPFQLAGGATLAVGVTAKYSVGHFMMNGAESTGSTQADPISVELQFPIVHTQVDSADGGYDANNGSGMGLDLGVAFQSGMWSFSAAVQNVVNTFEWDESRLRYREGTIIFDADTRDTEFESVPYEDAGTVPSSIRSAIEDATFKPVIAAGAAAQFSPRFKAAADIRLGSEEGIRTGPKSHIGAGVEYRLFSFLPIRLGGAFIQIDGENSGLQYGGGLGIELGVLNLSAAVAQRSTDLGKDTMVMVSVLSFGM